MDYARLEQALLESLSTLADGATSLLPSLLGALVLFLVGWLLARLVRGSLRRLLDTVLGRIGARTVRDAGLRSSGVQRRISWAVSSGGFWLVLFVFLFAAVRVLDFPVLNDIFVTVGGYLPHIAAAGLTLLVGYLAGELARSSISHAAHTASVAYGELMGRGVQIGILALALVVAVDELGIDSTFLVVAASVILAATFGGAALAFGLGARIAVSNLLASHYVQRSYRAGQRIRIDETDGRILEITETAVVLETRQGRVQIPAALFSEKVSVLLTDES